MAEVDEEQVKGLHAKIVEQLMRPLKFGHDSSTQWKRSLEGTTFSSVFSQTFAKGVVSAKGLVPSKGPQPIWECFGGSVGKSNVVCVAIKHAHTPIASQGNPCGHRFIC